MIIEAACRGDAAGIIEVLSKSFPGALLPFIPLGCPGGLSYVEDQLALRDSRPDSLWMVLRNTASPVAGFLELRLYPNELLINHIYVLPEARSAGVGTLLLMRTLETALRPEVNLITLDVFMDNTKALGWYARLGFVPGESRSWLKAGIRPLPSSGWFCTEGLPQADCVQQRYGFSGFKLKTLRGVHDIGRLGADLFRAADETVLADPDALAALHQLDARRSLFVRASDAAGPRPQLFSVDCVARSVRMSVEPRTLLERLAAVRKS